MRDDSHHPSAWHVAFSYINPGGPLLRSQTSLGHKPPICGLSASGMKHLRFFLNGAHSLSASCFPAYANGSALTRKNEGTAR